jgi:hypothetical protein
MYNKYLKLGKITGTISIEHFIFLELGNHYRDVNDPKVIYKKKQK